MARFTNQAQLRYGNEITNSNIAVGEITEVLSATKTAVRDTYGQNENVTYGSMNPKTKSAGGIGTEKKNSVIFAPPLAPRKILVNRINLFVIQQTAQSKQHNIRNPCRHRRRNSKGFAE